MTTHISQPETPQRQRRTWYGTLGNACDVLVAVNDVPVTSRTTIPLSSGAHLIVRPDGSWLYRAGSGDGHSLDAFTYVLQTPAGRIDATATIDLSEQTAAGTTPLVRDRRDGWLSSTSGDGHSAADPLQLSYEMLTGTTLNLQLRETDSTKHIDRAVLLLESDADLDTSVHCDGIINVTPRPGFQGVGHLLVLLETDSGRSQWLEVNIAVNPPLAAR